MEHGEGFAECAERETLEETGLKVKGVKLINATNDVFTDQGKHYITLFVVCEMLDPAAQPQVSRLLVPRTAPGARSLACCV